MAENHRLFVAVDMGGTQIRGALLDEQGTIHRRIARLTRPERGLAAVVAELIEVIRAALEGAEGRPVAGIGVAAPGPLDQAAGVVHHPPNLPGWSEVPLKAMLETELGIPVLLDNDANLAALGETFFGAGRGKQHLVYLTVSTGIGGGIIAGGRLLRGAIGSAGEVGHMTIDMHGPPCNCGNRGDLEAMASGTAIARRAAEEVRRGAETALRDLSAGDPDALTAQMVEGAARAGDRVAREIVEAAGIYLGVGVANLIQVLNPEMIVIGGGVTNAGEMLFEPMRRTVAARTMPVLRAAVEIVPAALGDDAGLVGAVALVQGLGTG